MATGSIINAAFEAAKKEFVDSLPQKDEYDFSNFATIHDVYDETDRIQDEQSRNGALRNLMKIQPYLSLLEQYSAVIEQFVQAKADVLALIWVRNATDSAWPTRQRVLILSGSD